MSHEGPPQFKKPPSKNLDIGGSNEKVAAMRFAADIGKQIQLVCPEIAMDYINGLSLVALAAKYDIQNKFGIANIQTARMAVMNALKGYSGKFSGSYEGLIKDPDILQTIGVKHKKDAGKKIGELTRDEGLGIFGMTKEHKSEVSTKVGIKAFQNKTGIHAEGFKVPPLSSEARSAIGKKSALTRGFTTFPPEAETFIRNLDLNSAEYQNTRTNVTKVNLKRITEEVNNKFYGGKSVINADAISSFLRRIRKKNAPK